MSVARSKEDVLRELTSVQNNQRKAHEAVERGEDPDDDFTRGARLGAMHALEWILGEKDTPPSKVFPARVGPS